MTEFRGFPPETRDELRAILGSDLTVQENDWKSGSQITPNHQRKLSDDVGARRGLTSAIDHAPNGIADWGPGVQSTFDLRQSV
jgi:hypothetical protein